MGKKAEDMSAEELEELLDNYHGPFGAELPFEP